MHTFSCTAKYHNRLVRRVFLKDREDLVIEHAGELKIVLILPRKSIYVAGENARSKFLSELGKKVSTIIKVCS